MPSLFEAYVTNLGKYNEGELVGETLKFPATTEEVQALLKRIGVDGIRYEEIFITSFDGDVLGLYDYLGEYENLDELNHLAHLLSDMGTADLEKFEAVIDSGEYTGSVQELINLTQNLDCFDFEPGISNDEELGRLYIQDYGPSRSRNISLTISTTRHTGGTPGSMKAATTPPAGMCGTTTAILSRCTTAGRIFPTSTAFSPTPSSISESRWRPTKALSTNRRWTPKSTVSVRGTKIGSTSRHFVP